MTTANQQEGKGFVRFFKCKVNGKPCNFANSDGPCTLGKCRTLWNLEKLEEAWP